ncbi:MAG: TraY domain-containing protein [Oscillospiraceae bacterium]
MNDKILRYTLRVDRINFKKFRYIASYQGRSANKEIEQFIKRRIAEFEKQHGEIKIDKD